MFHLFSWWKKLRENWARYHWIHKDIFFKLLFFFKYIIHLVIHHRVSNVSEQWVWIKIGLQLTLFTFGGVQSRWAPYVFALDKGRGKGKSCVHVDMVQNKSTMLTKKMLHHVKYILFSLCVFTSCLEIFSLCYLQLVGPLTIIALPWNALLTISTFLSSV